MMMWPLVDDVVPVDRPVRREGFEAEVVDDQEVRVKRQLQWLSRKVGASAENHLSGGENGPEMAENERC